MIIDVHTHYRAKGIFEELTKRGLTRIVVDANGRRHVYDGDYYRHTMPEQYSEPDIDKRVAYLDEQGIDIQVLSLSFPGVEALDPRDATLLSKRINNELFSAVKKYPERFAGFAAIAPQDPKAAAVARTVLRALYAVPALRRRAKAESDSANKINSRVIGCSNALAASTSRGAWPSSRSLRIA